jgi:hypothetical protein
MVINFEDVQSWDVLNEFDIEKGISNIISLNSPSSENTAKTMEIHLLRNKPEIMTYTLNSLKNEFQKVNNRNREKRKNLENKLKALEHKTNIIKQYSMKKGYSNSKYLKISLDKNEGRLEHKNMTFRATLPSKPIINTRKTPMTKNIRLKDKKIKSYKTLDKSKTFMLKTALAFKYNTAEKSANTHMRTKSKKS